MVVQLPRLEPVDESSFSSSDTASSGFVLLFLNEVLQLELDAQLSLPNSMLSNAT
jgi:hypothetical protein